MKNTFFSEIKQDVNIGSMPSHAMRQLLIFDESDRKNTGYDAIIITGSKKYLTKKDVIKNMISFIQDFGTFNGRFISTDKCLLKKLIGEYSKTFIVKEYWGSDIWK